MSREEFIQAHGGREKSVVIDDVMVFEDGATIASDSSEGQYDLSDPYGLQQEIILYWERRLHCAEADHKRVWDAARQANSFGGVPPEHIARVRETFAVREGRQQKLGEARYALLMLAPTSLLAKELDETASYGDVQTRRELSTRLMNQLQ